MKRILLIAGTLLGILVVALVIFLFTGLGGAIKAIVETVGSRATGTKVTLASADVSLTSGEGDLKGLVVGNPPGFKSPSAIELGQIRVKVDTSTVTSKTVVIKEVLIDGPKLTYELGVGGSNLGVIQANVAKLGGGSGKKTPEPEPEPAPGGGTKVIIEDLIVRGGRVSASASFVEGKELAADIPQIHLKDIGKAEGGATGEEVAQKLLGELTRKALDAAAGLGVEKLKDKAASAIDDALGDVLGGKKKKDK
jgi:hypothetical protein